MLFAPVTLIFIGFLLHVCSSETQFYRGAVESPPGDLEKAKSSFKRAEDHEDLEYSSRVPLRDAVEMRPLPPHGLEQLRVPDGNLEYYGAASNFNRRNLTDENLAPVAPSDGTEVIVDNRASQDKKLICYVTSWSFYRRGEGKFVPEMLPSNLCTHIVYAYATLAPDTLLLKEFDPWADIENGLYNRITSIPGAKKILAIGGWTDSAGDKYSKLVSSSAKRSMFISQAISFLKRYDFQGLHVDWQYPVCWQSDCKKGPNEDKANFATFIKELAASLKAESMILGVSVPGYPEVTQLGYDIRAISEAADYLSAMTYDYHGGWDMLLSHPTPLAPRQGDKLPKYTVQHAVKTLLDAGAIPSKLVLGLAFYGQSFRLKELSAPGSPSAGAGEPGEFTKQPGMMAYHEICYRVNSLRWKTGRQDNAGPYAYSGDQWVGFDDVDSIREKVQWALSKGLGGAAAWTVDLDDFSNRCCRESFPLLRATARALRLVTSPVPTPSCEKPPTPATPPPPTTTIQDDGYFKPSSTSTTWPSWSHSTTTTTRPIWAQTSTATKPTRPTTSTKPTAQTWWPTSSTTTPSAPTTTSQVQNGCIGGTFLPVKGDCGAYMVCAGGTWHTQRCAPALQWNHKLQRCDWPREVDCPTTELPPRPPSPKPKPKPSTTTTTTARTTTASLSNKPLYPPNFKCTLGNYYAHERCHMFYICVNHVLVAQSCAPGLAWNKKVSRCDFISETNCIIQPSKIETPAVDETSEKLVVEMKTTPKYPGTTGKTTTESQFDDLDSIDVGGNTLDGPGDECRDGEYFPYPGDCNRYMHCLFGHLEEFSCAPGLHWNHEKLTCDWPRNTKCKVTTEKIPGTSTPSKPKPTTKTPEWQPGYVEPAWTPPTTTTTPLPYVLDPALIKSGKKLVCYFTNWAWYRPGAGKYLPENIDPDLCTHIIYAFAVLGYDQTIKPHDSWADVDNHFYNRVLAYRRYGIKVILGLGGWNDSAGDKYSKLVNNPAARARFVETTVALLEKYGFDGLDLDWEYPKCWQVDCSKGPDSDKQAFSALVRELSAAFKPRGLLLSAAVSPNKKVIDAGYEVPVLSKHMDWIAVMTYDYHGQWDKKTGHVAPLYYHPEDDYDYFNANFTMNYWIEKGALPSKLVMGIPLYGQSFTLGTQWDTPPELLAKKNETGLNVPARSGGEAGQFTRAKGFLAYYEICERIQHRAWKVVQDPKGRMGPHAYKGDQWVSFDDKAIIRRKVNFAKSINTAGAMVWALDLDDFRNSCGEGKHPLLKTIRDELIKTSSEHYEVPDEYENVPEEHPNASTKKPEDTSTHKTTLPTATEHIGSEDKNAEVVGSGSDKKVICYFSNWAWYRPEPGKFVPEDIESTLCTHIVYAFASLHPEKLVVTPVDPWADIENKFYERVAALRSKGVRVLLAIGGWSDSGRAKYSRLVNCPLARAKFVDHVVKFLLKYGFDGLELNWQQPKCWQMDCRLGPTSDRKGYASLIRELRAAFNPRNLLLSAAVTPSKQVIDEGYDVPVLSENLDWVSIMAFDYSGAWNIKTGHVAPMYPTLDDTKSFMNVNFSLHYWLKKGLAPSKLILGIPFYGQSFRLEDELVNGLGALASGPGEAGESTKSPGFLSFFEICDRIRNHHWKMVADPSGRMGPYAYKADQWVSFDDASMVRFKGETIVRLGLGGAMVWALDTDDFAGKTCGCGRYPLLSALRLGLDLRRNYDSFDNCPKSLMSAQQSAPLLEEAFDIKEETTASNHITNKHSPSSTVPPHSKTSPSIDYSPTTTPQPITTAGVNSGAPCVETFAPHESCAYYYLCNNGRFIQRPCPPGLHWNEEKTRCDWPRDANCKSKLQT